MLSSELQAALDATAAEMRRQNAKWGQQDHDAYQWMSIIGEEMGEAFTALNEGDPQQYHQELIETAACCLQAVANLAIRFTERGGTEPNTVTP
jgi:NTP pyrophosphatase (non-canonical NTP hydrolase)